MLYAVEYKFPNKPFFYKEFATEIDMENHCNIWIDDDDAENLEYIDFFYNSKGYKPDWATWAK